MKDKKTGHPAAFQSELVPLANKYIIRVILCVVIPLLIALGCFFALKGATFSLLIILWIFAINLVVVYVDRMQLPQGLKAKNIGKLYKLQIISFGLFLFFEICIVGRWELIPWAFAFYYFAVIIMGIKDGSIISGALVVAVCISCPFSAHLAAVSYYDLMISFLPSSILCIVFMAVTEHVRNTYRHELRETNAGLAGSEAKYRSLYNQLSNEIRERKKVENRLLQSQKMESLSNLAGGIAHDFNNLLFPIVGMAHLLMMELSPDSPEYQNAQGIYEAGNKASDLVTQIRSFGRKTGYKMSPVRLPQVLEQALESLRQTIPSDIEIEQDIQKDCKPVAGDPAKVHQVIMNLMTNACHAIDSGQGKILIQLKEVALTHQDVIDSQLKSGLHARLSICDTGQGIDPAILERIFEPYFTTKKTGKRAGLGLAVVYGIVCAHGGEIQVFSEIGRGSTIDIFLPVIARPVEKDIRKPVEGLKTGDERILLVDNEPRVLSVQMRLLEKLGYQVTAENSAPEALTAFKADPEAYDLVLTDMAMPELAGDQLAKSLLSVRPDIPIIICTGFSEQMTPEKAEAMGIRGFLMKPVDIAVLAETIRNVLDGTESRA